jgi:hypothetical protein
VPPNENCPNYSAFRKRNDSRVTVSSSRKAVSFSSARTTNRFPSSRCASTIQIVRPHESTAATQPKLQPAFLNRGRAKSPGTPPHAFLWTSNPWIVQHEPWRCDRHILFATRSEVTNALREILGNHRRQSQQGRSSLGYVSMLNASARMIWMVDAHCGDGKCFVVHEYATRTLS